MSSALKFHYRNGAGIEGTHTLRTWSEHGHYITGYSEEDRGPRTFLKFRVLAFLDGSDALLADPRTPPPPRPSRTKPGDERPHILFTGFPRVQRADLERRAEEAGFRVVQGVTQHLSMLCCGPNAGPAKLQKTREQGSIVLRQDEFLWTCETGEIPDPDADDGI